MAECELLSGCLFFNDKMATLEATAGLMKTLYCRGTNESCARFMVYQKFGRAEVPPDLYPNQVDEAKKILFK